ncbi:hypothetical protein DL767_006144 [Monosporascus sp. MG133]|nr:hypothetical protein DL767_006144 [Monosporascus sp. MG133]
MGRLSILRKAFNKLDGFYFGKEPIDLSDDIYYALVEADQSLANYSVDMVVSNVLNRLTTLFKTCTLNEDVYRRVGGGESFWFFIAAAWNPLHPLTPEEIEDLVSLIVESRRNYAPKSQKSVATILTNAVDSLIKLADEVDSRGPQQQVVSLRGTAAPGSTAWPPEHVSSIDVALMAVKGVREKVFGVSNTNQGQDVALPKRLDEPLTIRAYLSHLSLSKLRPDASVVLYLAPIAFVDHQQRQAWYKTTGHKSRLYSTAPEFLEYAHRALSGKEPREHAVCLLAPWFFEPADAARAAQETDAPIPTAWLRSCPRAGMALVLSRAKENEKKKKGKGKGRLACRAMLFQPGPPRYADAAEPTPERRAGQDAWLSALFGAVDAHFDIREGYVGGTTLQRYENTQPGPDSVELACQFVRELVEDPEKGVPEGWGLVERGFALAEHWDDGN